MKTIGLTRAGMAQRASRFRDLKPLPTQAEDAGFTFAAGKDGRARLSPASGS
jgi:hypothetical protein